MDTIPLPRLFDFHAPALGATHKRLLCGVCRTLNFDFDFDFYRKISRDIRLGTWGEILRSQSCAFCRLVASSLTASPDQSPRDLDDQIVLSNDVSWQLGVEQSPYDRLNSDTCSNIQDRRSAAKQLHEVAYRLVIYVYNDPDITGCTQYLAHSERKKDDRQFFGRGVDREHVDVRLLKRWLRTCEDWHEDICEQDGVAGLHLPKNLRLIDVEQRILVKPPPTERV